MLGIKKPNLTSLDEKAFLHSIYRETNETLEAFSLIVNKAAKLLNEYTNDSFELSLGFITSKQDKNLFEIKPIQSLDFIPRIKISCNNIYIWNDAKTSFSSSANIIKPLSEVKFLIDFKNWLSGLNLFLIEDLQLDNSWHFLQTKNLMKFDTLQYRKNYDLTNLHSVELPENYIFNIECNSSSITLQNIGIDPSGLNNPLTQYSLSDSKFSRLSTSGYSSISYNYSSYPLVIKWLPFEYFAYNDKDFDSIALDSVKYESDSLEYKRLNQTGAIYYNELLKLHNNYWSEE